MKIRGKAVVRRFSPKTPLYARNLVMRPPPLSKRGGDEGRRVLGKYGGGGGHVDSFR